MRVKIVMDTVEQAKKIEAIAKGIKENAIKETGSFDDIISITDSAGFKVNACSFIGLLYAMEFVELWLEADGDYYNEFNDFIIGKPLDPPATY